MSSLRTRRRQALAAGPTRGGPRVKGNLVPDAYLAAVAIQSGSEWVTRSDFARFPGLRCWHPDERAAS